MGLGLGRLFGQIQVHLDVFGFAWRKKLLGFDQANAFLRRVGKRSIIPLLRKNGAMIGENCDIEVPLVFHNCQDFRNLEIGDNVHIGKNCFFDLRDKVVVERNVVISMQTTILTHLDMERSELRKYYPASQKRTIVKNNSYIGARSTLLMGVVIGENSIIAAGSIINKNIDPYTLVGGVPAKKIKDLPRA